MEPVDYLRNLISHWRIVLAAVVLAVAVAWFASPAQGTPAEADSYTATSTLVRAAGSEQSMTRAAIFMTRGKVAELAAGEVSYDGDPAVLADTLDVVPDDTVGTLTVSLSDEDADRAREVVDAFVDQTVAMMVLQQAGAPDRSELVRVLREEVDRSELVLAGLDAVTTEDSGSVRQTRLLAAEADLRSALQRLGEAVAAARAEAAPLDVVGPAESVPTPDVGFSAPASRLARIALAALGGLALGVALALLVARIDTRLRRRPEVQAAFGLPVLAQIPYLPWWQRTDPSSTLALDPAGPVADAIRPLRSVLAMTEPQVVEPGRDHSATPRRAGSTGTRSLVVVSAQSREGRTTVAVNAAACLAESGRRVLVVDCDLRNPQSHRLLGVPPAPGLTDVTDAEVSGLVRPTVLPGVSLLQAGTNTSSAALLPSTLPRVMAAARELADVVILDCPPMMAGTEAMDAMANVDATLVVCRAGRTSRDDAERVRELLARLRVPVYGVVLLGARDGSQGLGMGQRRRVRFVPAAEPVQPEPDSGATRSPAEAAEEESVSGAELEPAGSRLPAPTAARTTDAATGDPHPGSSARSATGRSTSDEDRVVFSTDQSEEATVPKAAPATSKSPPAEGSSSGTATPTTKVKRTPRPRRSEPVQPEPDSGATRSPAEAAGEESVSGAELEPAGSRLPAPTAARTTDAATGDPHPGSSARSETGRSTSDEDRVVFSTDQSEEATVPKAAPATSKSPPAEGSSSGTATPTTKVKRTPRPRRSGAVQPEPDSGATRSPAEAAGEESVSGAELEPAGSRLPAPTVARTTDAATGDPHPSSGTEPATAESPPSKGSRSGTATPTTKVKRTPRPRRSGPAQPEPDSGATRSPAAAAGEESVSEGELESAGSQLPGPTAAGDPHPGSSGPRSGTGPSTSDEDRVIESTDQSEDTTVPKAAPATSKSPPAEGSSSGTATPTAAVKRTPRPRRSGPAGKGTQR